MYSKKYTFAIISELFQNDFVGPVDRVSGCENSKQAQ